MNDLSDRIAGLSPAKRQLLELRLKDELLASPRKTEDAKGLTLPPIERIPHQARHPASFSQSRLWFIEQLSPGPAYNSEKAIRLTGPLDLAALEQSINEIVRRQDALRTIFSPLDGEPFQVITPPSSLKLPMVDLRAITETAEREVEAERVVTEETECLFDLEKGPLFRGKLVRLSDEDHILVLVMHHIISDGWSWGVFFRELESFYVSFSTGSPSPHTELPVQYVDFAHWQHDRLQGDILEQQLSYWKKQLSGAPELLDLPTDRPRPAVQTFRGASQSVMLSKSFTEQLKNLSRAEGVTLFMTLLAACQALLCRLTRQEDIVVGSPFAGRNRSEIEGLIGFFINTIVLRTDLSGNPSFRELLGRVREVALGAYAHPDVPFERLMEELKVERSLSRSSIFQVMFTFQNFPRQTMTLPGLTVRPVKIQKDTAKFDLTLYAVEGKEGLTASFRYNSDLFDEGTIERMLGHFKTLLEGVVANPEWRLSELPLLTAAQRHQLLVEWNNTSRDYPKENCIHRLFEEQAKRTPAAAAVVFEEKQLTYRELNDAANRLAFLLSEKGIGKGCYVPILMERSMEVAISMLSIMKVGAAFVPLDVRWPTERIKQALDDLPTGVVLVNKKTPFDQAELGRAFLVLDDLASGGSTSNPNIHVEPWQPIYAIYTSGSTGRPKAAVVPHRGITNRFLWMNEFFGCEAAAVVLQTTPHIYDSAVWQLFWPLINGGTTIIPSPGMEIAADYLSSLIARYAVTMTDFVPSVFNTIVPQLVAGDSVRRKLGSLRCIIVGGEEIRPGTTYNFMEHFPHVRVVNLYGPTEASIGCIYYEVIGKEGDRIPIGRPISNVQVLILDRNMNPVPVGVAGELYLSGICLGLGYLNDEQKTNAAFIDNRFAEISYSKMYNTGDLARYLPDGNIEFLGRLDNQVKIRGFRIELGEIDAVLGRHPAIQQVVTLAREDEPGNKRLVAYVVPSEKMICTATELRSFLKTKLPDYMVPSAIEFLDKLPLTPNGKVARQALPPPDQTRGEVGNAFVAPRTPVEEAVAGVWKEILKIERLGIHDNFFELGGHSLLATQVISRLRETFHVDLPLRSVFEAPTVSGLAERIERTRGGEQGFDIPPLVPASRSGAIPLSFAQERLWFLDQLEPGSTTYNMSRAVRLTGPLDVVALERSVSEILRRHEALRTTFSDVDGQPFQQVSPAQPLSLAVIDLEHLPQTEREAEAQRRIKTEARRPFDLSHGPLMRAALLRLGAERHILLYGMHHIVSDGWSMGVFFRELSRLYQAFSTGRPSPLADLPIQYPDFAFWQRQPIQKKVLARQLDYWKEQLAALPVLDLPAAHPRPQVQTYRGARQSLVLSQTLSEALRALNSRENATLFMTLLTAFQTLLHRYTGQDDIAVGTPIAGRHRLETEGLIGFFLNTLVLRADLSGNPSFRDLLVRVSQMALEAYTHQDVAFEKLLEELRPERDLSRTPLFQVFFNMLAATDRLELAGLTAEPMSSLEPQSKFDLTVYVREPNQRIRFSFVYNIDIFSPDQIAEILGQFEHLLAQIVARPDERIDSFSLVTPRAERCLPNPTHALDPAWHGAVHERFSQQARSFPQRRAVVDKWQAWTYQELNSRSNQLANYLLAGGMLPQEVVAIYGHRSASLVWAVLGVLKAGAAFLILDPDYPASRLVDCLRMAKPRGWLQLEAAGEVPGALEEFIAVSSLRCRLQLPRRATAGSRDSLDGYSAADLQVEVGPDDLAYVAFTSGSTGLPKGILGRHCPLSHFLPWQKEKFNLDAADRFSMLSGLSHDPLQRDIFTPLWLGASICIPDPETIGTPKLAHWMVQEQITFAHLTPAMAQLLTETAGSDCRIPSLRYAFFVGDKLTRRDVLRLRTVAPAVICINSYGTTETQRAVGYYTVSPEPEVQASWDKAVYPLGRGMADVQLLVLTAAQRLAGVGELGEIYLRSPHLAQGYLGDEALTQARFLTNPYTGLAGDRLYKTGDLGRYCPDGVVEFAGRADNQVKIRGFRIELGEVEAALDQHTAVARVVAMVREDEPGEKRLIAYIVAEPKRILTVSELRGFLKEKMPDYLIPSAFVMLDSLPLTANGKVDYPALPAPDVTRPALKGAYAAPRTPVEEALAGIWSEVLGVKEVGNEEDFFDLGGHSLLATRLISRVCDTFRVDIPLRSLFKTPTVAGLAASIESARRQEQVSRRAEEKQADSRVFELQLGQSQKQIFCFPYAGGFQDEYFNFTRLARLMGTDYSFYGLRARGTDGVSQPYHRIEDMAVDYVTEIQKVQPHGPYFLLGECGGSPEAYETARQLRACGEEIALLAVFDSRSPGPLHLHRYLKRRLTARLRFRIILITDSSAWKYLKAKAEVHLREIRRLKGGERLRYLFDKMRNAGSLVSDLRRANTTPSQPVNMNRNGADRHASRHMARARKARYLARHRYRPRPYDGRITLLINEEWHGTDKTFGWAGVAAGGVEVHKIPGNHETYITQNIHVVAQELKQCLQEAEKRSPQRFHVSPDPSSSRERLPVALS